MLSRIHLGKQNRLVAAAAAGRLGSFILPGYTHTLCSSRHVSPFMSTNANRPDEGLLMTSSLALFR